MFTQTRRRAAALIVPFAVAALVLTASEAGAVSGTMPVNGQLVSQVLTAGCTSPIGLCTAGSLNGGIQGDFVFTAASLAPTNVPTVLSYTGTIVIHTKTGNINIRDAGIFDTTGNGPVVDLSTVTGGTGDFAGASGYLEIFGTFTFAAGGNSDYRGKLVLP